MKQSVSVVLTGADFDDLEEEEDETERNEVEDNAKLISEKSNLSFLHTIQKHVYQNSIDANSISMFRFIQSPPPKI